MSTQRIVTVIGATGTQGGAVARALLADGTFAVRAVTRNMHSPKAEALTALGAEVVQSSLDDQDSLLAAFDGATAAQFRSFGFPGADELGNMFQDYAEFPDAYNGRRDVDAARALNPEPASLASFLTAHQDQLAR